MSFDPIGAVVDWLDACREGEIAALIPLYHPQAVQVCGEERAQGHAELSRYWERYLPAPHPEAFQLRDVALEANHVVLYYLDFDGKPARSHVEFDEGGRIVAMQCSFGCNA
jgi:ketosteroid isomerase-like protein